MSTRTLLLLAGLGVGGFLLYQWLKQSGATAAAPSPGAPAFNSAATIPYSTQTALNQIDQGAYNAQSLRMGDQLPTVTGLV